MIYVNHADLGGQPGHGAVQPEPEGEPFHTAWEPRVHAVTLAMGATGCWNIDMSRAARETLPDYAQLSYYEKWLGGLEVLLRQFGLPQAAEIAQGGVLHPARPLARVLRADDVGATLARGAPTERASAQAPRFEIGAAVRTRADAVAHHTRLPGYTRGRRGTVEARHGAHVFADSHAQGLGEQPCWLYTVVFDGHDLWADEPGAQGLKVSIDAWDPYLEPA